MTNNDILRRLRYVFDYDDAKMIAIFAHTGTEVRRGHIVAWLLKEEDPAYEACNDYMLANFLNGLIIEKRGKREGPSPVAERKLTNNLILMKLRIALNMQSDDIINTLELAGFSLSASELGSFMRKPGHRNYRPCKDQVLRNFLTGLQFKLRGAPNDKPAADSPWKKKS